MGLFRRTRSSKEAAAVVMTDAAPMSILSNLPSLAHTETAHDLAVERDDASDVFVCKREAAAPEPASDPSVTLIVTGWQYVEPGPLAWPFPSMRSALEAVHKMKNAVEWSIVLGKGYESVEEARAKGAVLIEQRL